MLEVGTFVLAIATAVLAAQAYLDRVERRQNMERRLLRSALLEQVDNARSWSRINPSHGGPAISAPHAAPEVVKLTGLLDGLTLPSDLTGYLLYARTRMLDLGDRHHNAVKASAGGDVYGMWWGLLDEIQAVVCLLRAHGRSVNYLREVADGAPRSWDAVEPGVPGERAFNAQVRVKTGEAPPWPGGLAYADCAPAARDAAGAAEAARQREVIAESLQEALHREGRPTS